MNVQQYPAAPEAAAERMVLGRMVLRIEDSGRAVSESTATYGAVSGKEVQPPVAPDENPFQSGDGANGFYLSKSRLNRYIACPRSYLLHYDIGIVPLRPDKDLLIGRSTHRLIAAHHLARKKEAFVDAQGVLDGFWSKYMPEGEDLDATIRQEMEAARTESLRYAQLFIRDVPLDPLEIERDFSLPLVNLENGDTLPVPLVGVIDLVDQPNGVLRPLEIKTRARKADAWQVRLALELTCYAWWVRQRLMETSAGEPEEIPVGYVNIIKTKTPTIQWQTDCRTIADLLDLYRTARAVYESIMDRRFYRNPGTHCNWCDFPAVCGKDKDAIVRNFGDAAYLRLWEADLI